MLIKFLVIFWPFALLTLCFADSWTVDLPKLITSARSQVGITVGYDPQYRQIPYPKGDVPKETGVCTEVLIRALRDQGIDLQQSVHDDMKLSLEEALDE